MIPVDNKDSLGVVVGRFQTDALTEAHLHLIRKAQGSNARLLIVIGEERTPLNATNPLSFAARAAMIRQYFPTAIVVRLLRERSDVVWCTALDNIIDVLANGSPVTLYCGRDGFSACYAGKHKIELVDSGRNHVSATARRTDIITNPAFADERFRRGVIYAMGTKHFQTYTTVDGALLRYNDTGIEVLLVRKPNEPLWRFPGGFVDEAKHETFTSAVAREVWEETGLTSGDKWKIIEDFPMPDEWRIRGQRGVGHRTVLLVGWWSWGQAKPSDDVSETDWVSLNQLAFNHGYKVTMQEEHHPLVLSLLSYTTKTP